MPVRRSKTPTKRRGGTGPAEGRVVAATGPTADAGTSETARAVGTVLLVIAIFLSVFVHAELRRAEFVWDDRAAIKGNADVRGATPLASIWHHDFWGQTLASPSSHKSYRPLCVLAFRANYWWSGLDASSYHVVNVLLHAATTAATFWLSRVLLSVFVPQAQPRRGSVVPLASGFAALLFSVHPVHVEAVAGLVSRADIMAALAMIVCVISYVRAKQSGSFGLFATSLALALFASLSKETGATVVLLMLLLEVLPFEEVEEKEVEKESTATNTTAAAPALRVCTTVCATAAFFFVRVRMHGGHSLRKWQLMENHVAMLPTTPLQRWLTIAHTHARYAQFALLPQRGMLAYDHGFNSNTTAIIASWRDTRNIGTVIAYTAVLITLLIIARSRSRFLAFALMATLVPLAPALNVAFWIGTLLAERLLYIPSIGICLGAGYLLAQPFRAFLLYDCGSSFSPSTPVTESSKTSSTRAISPSVAVLRRGNTVRTFAYALLILAVVGNMSLHSYQRSLDWLDEESIYKSGYDSEPNSVKIINNYAQVLLRSGTREDAAEADRILGVSIELAGERYPSAVFNRGLALSTLGNKTGAVRLFVQALSEYPIDGRAGANVHGYLAQELMEIHYEDKLQAGDNTLDYTGTYRSDSSGYLALVEWHALRALHRGCKMPLVHFTLGNVYQETRRHDLAVEAYTRALRMNENPYLEKGYSLSETDARNMFALAYQSRRGDCKRNTETDALRLNVTESFAGDVAAAEYKHADPFSVVERIVVTSCADSLAHDTKRAIDEYTKCADIDPNFFQAFVNAGVLHEEIGDSDLAEKSYMRALEISPDNGMVLNNLAVVVLKRGALQEALDLAERAYALIGEHGSVILTYQRALEAVAKWLYETGKQDDGSGERTKKPLEALNLYFKIFALGPAQPTILVDMVKAFLTIESMEERRQVGDAMTNIRDSVLKMPPELVQKLLPESFFVSLARALESVGQTAEAAAVLSKGREILSGSRVASVPAVAAPLLSFRLEDLPEGVKFEFFDGQVAEVAALRFVEKHGLNPIVEWTNRLARAVRDNLSMEMREKEAALDANKGALLFLIPVENQQEKQSVQCFMFCEHDRRDVRLFVQQFCLTNSGTEETAHARCTKIVEEYIKDKLSSLSEGSLSVE